MHWHGIDRVEQERERRLAFSSLKSLRSAGSLQVSCIHSPTPPTLKVECRAESKQLFFPQRSNAIAWDCPYLSIEWQFYRVLWRIRLGDFRKWMSSMCLRFFIVPTVISTGAATTSHSFCLKEQESVRNGYFRTKTVLLCSKSISNSINVCSADCNKVSLCRWPIELEIRRKARGRKKESKKEKNWSDFNLVWLADKLIEEVTASTKASTLYKGFRLHGTIPPHMESFVLMERNSQNFRLSMLWRPKAERTRRCVARLLESRYGKNESRQNDGPFQPPIAAILAKSLMRPSYSTWQVRPKVY